jgi:hypothetical protein
MDFRTFLPLVPPAFRGLAKAFLDRLDSIERRLAALEQSQSKTR